MRSKSQSLAFLFLFLLISGRSTLSAQASLRGIEEIGLRLNIRIEATEAVERLDEAYLRNLINWQLDQYRVKVASDNPGLPFLSLHIEVERLLGPARLKDESDRQIEGLYESTVEVEFHQQVVSKENPGYEFWAPTYRRSTTTHAETREQLQRDLIRSLERNLISFINTYRRENPR